MQCHASVQAVLHAHLVVCHMSASTRSVTHAWPGTYQGAGDVGSTHVSGRTVASSTVETVGPPVMAFQWLRAEALAPGQMPDNPSCGSWVVLESCSIALARVVFAGLVPLVDSLAI